MSFLLPPTGGTMPYSHEMGGWSCGSLTLVRNKLILLQLRWRFPRCLFPTLSHSWSVRSLVLASTGGRGNFILCFSRCCPTVSRPGRLLFANDGFSFSFFFGRSVGLVFCMSLCAFSMFLFAFSYPSSLPRRVTWLYTRAVQTLASNAE